MPDWGDAPRRLAWARVTRSTFALTFAFALSGIALSGIALAPGCSAVQPEVGERLAACVDADSNPAVKVSFKDQIRPLMDGRVLGPKPCADCHYHSSGLMGGIQESGLDLETLVLLKKGGRLTAGDIIVPGQPCKSAVVQKVRGTRAGARMPRGGPFWTPEQVQLLVDWIAEGAEGADDE